MNHKVFQQSSLCFLRKTNHKLFAAFPAYWMSFLLDSSSLEWTAVHLCCLSHTWISQCISLGCLLVKHPVLALGPSPGHSQVCCGSHCLVHTVRCHSQVHTDWHFWKCQWKDSERVDPNLHPCTSAATPSPSPHHRITPPHRPSGMCQVTNEALQNYFIKTWDQPQTFGWIMLMTKFFKSA